MTRRVTGTLGLAWLLATAPAEAQPPARVHFTQITRPVAEVTDRALIDFLLFELFIEPAQPPARLAVIDVTLNGYGPDDVLVTYPSAEAFLIPALVPDSVQRIMSSWAPEVEYRLDAGNLPADALAALIASQADTTSRAEKAILYDVVQAVERNYRDLPLGILYERDSIGFTFQMWDYNPGGMEYVPRPAFSSDSTVQSVLDVLKEVGYLPGQSATGGGAAFSRPAEGIATVANVLLAIRSAPEEQTRQVAARTVLVGSFDFDRSGAIDTPREVDAVSCDVWNALDATFPRFLYRYGFTDRTGPYFGNMLFGFSESVRDPAAARGVACLEGRPPPETVALVRPAAPRAPTLPTAVGGFLPTEAAADVVRSVGSAEPGSATWATAVRTVLVQRFDANASGMLETSAEVDAIPCQVWQAVAATHEGFLTDLGFAGPGRYVGDRIGIAPGQRERATDRARACARGAPPVVAHRARADGSPVSRPGPGPGASKALADALADLGAMPHEDDREITARTVLLLWLDADRSGHIDTAAELDAISCDVWSALGRAFPDFAERYGFVPGAGAQPYLGGLVFNISARLRAPAQRRAAACLRGEEPPATRPEDVAALPTTIPLPVTLEQFLQNETAGRIARVTARLEPGSAVWASSVRTVLLGAYDLDRSGALDQAAEVDAVPCVVWQTVQATFQGPLSGLGFGATGQYVGHQIGVAETQRVRTGQRILACTQ